MKKYAFYQKLCQTKFIDHIEPNNFPILHLFRISHTIVKKLKFKLVDFNVLNNFVS